MSKFKVQGTDGKMYRVEAPDEESAADAVDEMMRQSSIDNQPKDTDTPEQIRQKIGYLPPLESRFQTTMRA